MVTGFPLIIIFVASIAVLLAAILVFKLNPFLALLITAILTAFAVGMPLPDILKNVTAGFGNTLAGIGIIIGLGVILGQVLAEAHATDEIAATMLRKTGEKRAPLALNLTGFFVSIPVFFDAAFIVLTPLMKNLSVRTKKSMVTYVTALAIGLITTHALVIPTPGPVTVAGNMKADMGFFILYALLVSLPAALIGGWLYGTLIGKNAPLGVSDEDLKEIHAADNGAKNNPTGGLSLVLLLFPIMLILIGSILGMFLAKGSPAAKFFAFIGDKNIAILIGVLTAMAVLKKHIAKPMGEVVAEALNSAGVILLITGAGGAFGTIINASGIGKYIVSAFSGMQMSLIVLGFVLSQILRAAQGSTTVALVTTSSILGPVAAQMGASPILVGLAICAGGIGLSLPNDSGFWVVNRFSRLSVTDTFKAWTIGGSIAGLTALVCVLVLNLFKGVLPGL